MIPWYIVLAPIALGIGILVFSSHMVKCEPDMAERTAKAGMIITGIGLLIATVDIIFRIAQYLMQITTGI